MGGYRLLARLSENTKQPPTAGQWFLLNERVCVVILAQVHSLSEQIMNIFLW